MAFAIQPPSKVSDELRKPEAVVAYVTLALLDDKTIYIYIYIRE
jgi:hypothetical protein